MKTDRKLLLFISVFILLVISIVYRLMNPFVQKETETLTYGNVTRGQQSVKSDSSIPSSAAGENDAKNIAGRFLEKPKMTGKVHRNLFALYPPPRKKEIKKVEIPSESAPIEKIPAQTEEQIHDQIKAYMTAYTFYGTYRSGEKRAVFLAKDKMVLIARKGDRVEGKYLIEDIQEKYITVKALDQNVTVQLAIREFNNE